MNKKGISPLMSEVLLVAFAVTVAVIIGTWYTGFTKQSTQEVSEQSQQTISCTYGGVRIYDVTYNSTSGNITGLVENTGNIKLTNVDLQIICKDGSVYTRDKNYTLLPREEVYFNVQLGCSSFQDLVKVRVTTSCTSVYDDIEPDYITVTS